MKKIFTLVATTALTLGLNAQSVTISKVDKYLANDYASGCEIDIDNDGIKELIVGGYPNTQGLGQVIENANEDEILSDRAAWLLKFNGTDYTATQFSSKGVFGLRGSVIPADFDGDGNVDIYIASGGDENTLNGIYLNDGNGNFTKDDRFKVLDEDGNPIVDDAGELRWLPRSVDVADFNNDGMLDIVSCGWWLNANSQTAMGGVLLNNGDGTYTVTNRTLMGKNGVAFAMSHCTVKAYDVNCDGYADFILNGNVDNTSQISGIPRLVEIYYNVGKDAEAGTAEFYAAGLGLQYGNGNIAVADYDNDGIPDIFISGEMQGSPWSYKNYLYKGEESGDGITFAQDQTFVANEKDIRPLNSTNVGVRAIDYNGDGYFDLFLDGWATQMLDGSANTQGGFLLPGSDAGLVSATRIPGASEQGIFFLDYGVEGDLNYTFTGYHGDNTYFDGSEKYPTGRSMVFTKNPWTVASRPDAPSNLNVQVEDHTVTLSWMPAASSMNNVTYEVYLKCNGKVYNGCASFIGGDKDGVRKVLREGNAYMNTSITLELEDGTFEWGVQTINAALKGSTFAKGNTFSVGSGTGIEAISKDENSDEKTYNIAGQRVGSNYKGIVIRNGKKIVQQ